MTLRSVMKILAIDVGIKNLSFCVLSASGNTTDQMRILEWDNVCTTEEKCSKIKIETLAECLLSKLMEAFDQDTEVDIVAIENQPMLKNGLMKTVSVMIYTYFNMLKLMYGNIKEVKFISATNKLKCNKAKDTDMSKESYKNRKKMSIVIMRKYLCEIDPERIAWFDALKKADDYSDCCLFAIYLAETTRFN